MSAFAGINAVVTGSSYGIGAATAERLAAGGANVVICGRTATPADRSKYQPISLEETAARLREYGTTIVPIRADMGDESDRDRLIERAADALGGPVDILVNNAAAGIYKPNVTYPAKHRKLMTEVNFHAPFDLMQQAIPAMVDKGTGWIVNVTSGVARYQYGTPEPTQQKARAGSPFGASQGVYGATKAALNRITVAFAAELADTGVRVNAVEPSGLVLSDGAVARGVDGIPQSAVQPMEAMVEAIVALCSCEPERTGGVYSCIPLLEELGRDVMTLDGRAVFPRAVRATSA